MVRKIRVALKLGVLVTGLAASYVFFLGPYLSYLALNIAGSDCISIENAIKHGGRPESDVELLRRLSEFAFYEPDRTRYRQLTKQLSRGDIESLRNSKRDVFNVRCHSRECAVAYCVIPSRATNWSCSAELHVDADSSAVSLMVCGGDEKQITMLDGYAVLLHGGIVRIPECESTACLARFLLDGEAK